ncbi:MAG: protein-L-isoaspartate(D-aspartate) O-methyltransferase [Pseudomonadales bacterium]
MDGSRQRQRMVQDQIAARGIDDARVLAAMGRVPRERFVPATLQANAYDDAPLPIGDGQTISQPFIVAYMVAALALEGGERVLEIGTGSGYAAAVLAEIATEVYTVERLATLAEAAADTLAAAGYERVHVRCGDGTLGWPEASPFDAILVSAGGPDVPATLRDQLAPGGRLVIPVGQSRGMQRLVRVTRTGDGFDTEDLEAVRFVPLIGAEGWSH